jgi:hypothetical protein
LTSLETIGSAQYSTIPLRGPSAARRTAALTSSAVTGRFVQVVRSTVEPSGTGTFIAIPASRPFRPGMSCCTARGAQVSAGMMFSAAERERLSSVSGTSARFCSRV